MKKSLFKRISFTIPLLLLMGEGIVQAANIFSGGLPPSEVQSLGVKYYTNDTYGKTYIVPAMNNWNGISSKVKLNNVQDGRIKVNAFSGTTSQDGLLGRMFPYYTTWYGGTAEDTSLSKTWTYTDVYAYANQMKNYNMNDSQIKSNYTHEFGHALSLAHVTDSNVSAVMKQGIQSIGPTTTDKNNLKAKWGN
jgi:hypothetical protein